MSARGPIPSQAASPGVSPVPAPAPPAPAGESGRPRSRRASAFRRMLRHRSGTAGAIIVIAMVLLALLASWIAPYPEHVEGGAAMRLRLRPPDRQHLFGTDHLGRDVFTRVLFGARISLTIGVLAVVLSTVAGSMAGIYAGFRGGRLGEAIMRLADLFLGLPALVLAMLIAFTLGGGVFETVTAIAIPWWPLYARLVRSEVLRLKETDFVEAARSVGATDRRILLRHVLPNSMAIIIVQASLQMGQAILVAASLGFIGLGAKPPSPEWGLSVAIGREYIPDGWWVSFFPGMAILVFVIGVNLLGDGLRVALDPRTIGTEGERGAA